MLKNLTISFFLLSVSYPILAQKAPFGLKAGMNFSSIGGDSENLSPKVGMHAGFFSSLMLTEKLSIKPEIVLSNQGAVNSENSKLRFSYWYLNAPLMFRYQEETAVFFDFGVQVGTIINANFKQDGEKENITSQLENFDFSVSAGFGHDLSEDISIEARYNHGLTNTSKNQELGGGVFPNRVLQFTIAYVLFK